MTILEDRIIALDNDFEVPLAIRRRNTNTGLREPATGLTITCKIAATRISGAIGALDLSMAERSGAPGSYFVIFSGAALRTALAGTYLNKKVYVIATDATGKVRATLEYTVKETRDL